MLAAIENKFLPILKLNSHQKLFMLVEIASADDMSLE